MMLRTGHQSSSSCTVVGRGYYFRWTEALIYSRSLGHTATPSDFCWAPGEREHWTLASVSEDNIVMAWSPSMRIWAGDEVKVDAEQLEAGMEGIVANK